MAKNELSTWLERKISGYINDQQRRVSIGEIAEYLDINESSLSHYLTGRRTPSDDTIIKIAAKFGPEIYDVLGLPRPDPMLKTIIELWPKIPGEGRTALKENAEKYVTDEGAAKDEKPDRVHRRVGKTK